MKLIDLYPYLTNGQKLLVILPIDAGTEETFNVEIMRDQRFGSWRTEYGDWLEELDLDIDNIFAGDSGNLMLTCKPKMLMPNPGMETANQQFGITICSGCAYENGGDIRCEECSRMYFDRYKKKN